MSSATDRRPSLASAVLTTPGGTIAGPDAVRVFCALHPEIARETENREEDNE